ncbi:hypothetical protein SeMB42_g03799 [Synchytrium endobioticum]|uniref:Uncharacterized protein n=1 Tax=Synchytrium endobioticum TaxID=286115 RepID=A0A507D3Y7_9FUNG|nr:hypothetical protein SeMB42_g03799 [Synchytrium endobioticum]
MPIDAPNRERGVKTGNIDKAWRILGIHTKSRDVLHDDEEEQDAHVVAAPIINVNDDKMDYNEDGAGSLMLSKVYVQHRSNNINETIKKWAKPAVSSMHTSRPMTSPSSSVDVSKMLLYFFMWSVPC